MTMPPQDIQVICPKCGRQYKDWFRASINMSLGEEFDDEYLDAATSSTCPHCHYKVRHEVLIVGKDGVWQIGTQESRQAVNMEEAWHQAMLDIYTRAKKECRYTATYFIQMVTEHGGLEAAQMLLHTDTPSDGFTTLWEHHRLDLSVEYHVLLPRFGPLFTDEERAIARRRLEEYGFTDFPPGQNGK